MTLFTAEQIHLAHQRLASVLSWHHAIYSDDFYAWLIPPTPVQSEHYGRWYVPAYLGEGTEAHTKMTILLSDHWKTLIKAHLIRHPWTPK